MTPIDLTLADGRALRVHDTGERDAAHTLLWHHGSPQTGAPLAPLLDAARERRIRLVSYARPGYGGSTPHPGRDVAAAARDVAQLADALGLGRFATMGASGGGPHALACAALLGDRVTAAACLAGLAPYDGTAGWFAGMVAPAGLRAALRGGRAARARLAATEELDEASFTAADWAALAGPWSSLGADAGAAAAAGTDGLVDDDVAFVAPWGFGVPDAEAPVLLVHGGEDRVVPPAHAERLRDALAHAELWQRPRDGHVSVLDACPSAIDWLLSPPARSSRGRSA